MRLAKTLNVQVGRKLNDRSKPDILTEVEKVFNLYGVVAIQITYEIIRVTFLTDEGHRRAKELSGVRLFGLWCPILGGGPPVTIVHVFDYPFEEDNSFVSSIFGDFGDVKKVKNQTSLANTSIYTGTRLVSIVLKDSPPRSLMINGYFCRIWYKGQPLICNLCGVQGHKSAACPNKDKCRRCGEAGHFARACTKAWATNRAPPSAAESSVSTDVVTPQTGSSGETSLGAGPQSSSAEDSLAAVSGVGPPPFPEPVLDAPPSAESELSASEVSLTCGQRVPDDSEPLGSTPTDDFGPSGSIPMDESGPSGSVLMDEQSQSDVQSQKNEESIVASSVCSGAKRAFSDPEDETNSSQSILVDAQDAQHLVKKIKRLFNRKGSPGGPAKTAAKPGRHSMPAVVSTRPPTRSRSISL